VRPSEQKKLQRMKRRKTNAVNARHARIILLSRGGHRNRDIAATVDCTPQWVRTIIHRFNQHGLDGITWFPWMHGDDRPRRFTAAVLKEIAQIALSPPKVLIGMTRWSLSKLRHYLIEQKIVPAISYQWLGILLRRAGVRWRRTRTWKESKDRPSMR
jgi:transposase